MNDVKSFEQLHFVLVVNKNEVYGSAHRRVDFDKLLEVR